MFDLPFAHPLVFLSTVTPVGVLLVKSSSHKVFIEVLQASIDEILYSIALAAVAAFLLVISSLCWRSTFQYILYTHALDNQKLDHIGKLIYDIEINTWQEKAWAETPEIQQALTDIFLNAVDTDEIIQQSMIYFDALYEKIL